MEKQYKIVDLLQQLKSHLDRLMIWADVLSEENETLRDIIKGAIATYEQLGRSDDWLDRARQALGDGIGAKETEREHGREVEK